MEWTGVARESGAVKSGVERSGMVRMEWSGGSGVGREWSGAQRSDCHGMESWVGREWSGESRVQWSGGRVVECRVEWSGVEW